MSDPNVNNQSADLAAMNQSLNNTANLALQINNSKKAQRFAREMNDRQRADNILAAKWQRKWALKDWERENYYNSPQQQMQRLKEAGLNPHLVYGNGATTTAGSINTTNVSTPNYQSEYGGPITMPAENPLAMYVDLNARQVQTDNMKLQAEIARATVNNLTIDGMVKSQDLQDKKLQYEIQTELKDIIIAERQTKLEASKQEIELKQFYADLATSKFSLDKLRTEFDRQRLQLQKATTTAQIDQITSNILRNTIQNANTQASTKQIEQNIRNLMQSQRYTAILTTLANEGLRPGSPEYIKRYTSMVSDLIGTLTNIIPSTKLIKTQLGNFSTK